MTESVDRRYLDDVPIELQDLIYDKRLAEAIQLLVSQRGLGRMEAMMEAGQILSRLQDEFPEDIEALTPKSGTSSRRKSLILGTGLLVLLLVGATISVLGVRGLVLAIASKQWPSAEGTIISSSVEESHGTDSNHRPTTFYHVRISYRFVVDGRNYSGNRVAFGDIGRGDPKYSRAVVSRYPRGKNVVVFYRAGDPPECLLEPGVHAQALILPGIGFLLLGLGVVFFRMALSHRRNQSNSASAISAE